MIIEKLREQVRQHRSPIADLLDEVLPKRGLVLEVASGDGARLAYLARRFPHLVWQPSDPRVDARMSIMDELEHSGLSNVKAPVADWAISRADAIVCVDPSPWSTALALLERSAEMLHPGHLLFLCGTFATDQLRTLEKAAQPAFKLAQRVAMSAKHYALIFERYGSSGQSGSTPEK
jgi:hypothetical protein